MTTSEKLRVLATAVRRNRRFNVHDPRHCIVAVGLRLRFDGTLSRKTTSGTDWLNMKLDFGRKFGMASDDLFQTWCRILPQ